MADSIEKLLGEVVEDDRGLHALLKAMVKQYKAKQVAFSASLSNEGTITLGTYSEHTPLIFKNVLTNIGKAYNPATGVFTAPAKGAYQFLWYFGAWGFGTDLTSAVALFKNAEQIFVASENHKEGYGSTSQGATLLLEAGDKVLLKLWNNRKVYDNSDRQTTFSGHMLFPM